MAEIITRREARRRRILENSENRLRKITGSNSEDIKDHNNHQQVKDNNLEAESLTDYDINGIVSEEEIQTCTRLNSNRYKSLLNETDNEKNCTSKPVSKMEFILCTLLFNRLNLILLAGIVNILLLLQLDIIFGQTIIIPYLVLMLGRLYSCNRFYEAQDGSLLSTALILCNIKPKLIYKFKMSFTFFKLLFNDFGLYMFSFILIRYVVNYYYQ